MRIAEPGGRGVVSSREYAFTRDIGYGRTALDRCYIFIMWLPGKRKEERSLHLKSAGCMIS